MQNVPNAPAYQAQCMTHTVRRSAPKLFIQKMFRAAHSFSDYIFYRHSNMAITISLKRQFPRNAKLSQQAILWKTVATWRYDGRRSTMRCVVYVNGVSSVECVCVQKPFSPVSISCSRCAKTNSISLRKCARYFERRYIPAFRTHINITISKNWV